MIASPLNVILSVGIGAMVLYAMVLLARRRVHGPLPPGPPGKPILGNIYDLPPPGAQDWMHWLKFKDRYGKTCHLGHRRNHHWQSNISIGFQDKSVLSLSWARPS